MTELSSVRAPFLTYFYWAIFLGFALSMSLFLHRMIALAAQEEEVIGITTLSNYQEQAKLYREKQEGDPTLLGDDFSDI